MAITIKSKTRLRVLSCAAAAMFIGAGCDPQMLDTASFGIFPQQETNWTQQNYAVADYLTQQTNSYIGRGDLIAAKPLVDTEQPGMASDISKMIPEQIGTRLAQLGYRMDLSQVAYAADPNYIAPNLRAGEKPGYILSGSYTRRRTEMDVNIRITGAQTGRVIAAHSYVMPRTREVNELATPEPKIVRMTDQ